MKILIIGASGYLGGMVYNRCSLNESIELYGTYCTNTNNVKMLKFDVFDNDNAIKIVKDIEPDIIVWCVMDESNELNVSEVGLKNILQTISENVRFIYISTMVSSQSNQNENVSPEILKPEAYHSNYVNGKIRGEELVKAHKNHVIIRPGQIFGFDAYGQPDIRMKRILQSAKAGEKCPRYVNSYISIVPIQDLVSCIIELFYNDFNGIINIAAQRPVSYYDFYKLMSRMLEIDEDIIAPVTADKPTNSFFDTTKCKLVLSTHIGENL